VCTVARSLISTAPRQVGDEVGTSVRLISLTYDRARKQSDNIYVNQFCRGEIIDGIIFDCSIGTTLSGNAVDYNLPAAVIKGTLVASTKAGSQFGNSSDNSI